MIQPAMKFPPSRNADHHLLPLTSETCMILSVTYSHFTPNLPAPPPSPYILDILSSSEYTLAPLLYNSTHTHYHVLYKIRLNFELQFKLINAVLEELLIR